MKKKNLFIVFFFSLFFVANLNSVFALDQPPCTDCEDGEWESGEKIYTNFQGCPACSVKVFYIYNDACKEIYVSSFTFMNSACGLCAPQSWSWEEVFGELKALLLTNGPFELYDGFNEYVKIRKYACWIFEMGNPVQPDPFLPCDDESCCKEEYLVVHSEQYGTDIAPIISTKIGDECSELCDDLCGSSVIPPSPKINLNENKAEDSKLDIESIIYPNPAYEAAVLEYSCKENGKLIFKIFDIQGNEVYSIEDEKTSESSTIELDLNSLSDDVYYYKVFLNNINISTGSLTIIK